MNLLNVAEVALRLGLCEKQIRRLIDSGQLAHVRIGKSIRVSQSDLDDFITKRRKVG